MITLYVDKNKIMNKKHYIESVDLTFDKLIYNLEITEKDKVDIKHIDNAHYEGNGYIVTPFGRTEIQNLSTGCKTLILLNHSEELGNPIVYIGECGKNVLSRVFEMSNINICIDFCQIPKIYNPEQMIRVINKSGERQMNLRDVFNKLWRNK